MDLESVPSELPATRQAINILCCMCGIPFKPSETGTRICLRCLTTQSDVTEGITKQGIVNFCRMCKRYMRPPWVYCERESRELLSICMQKVRGLNRVKIIDASFVWTEPHSRRIKLKMTVQREIHNNTQMQQSFVVEFYEHYMQCDDCKREFTPHTWGAVVQLRQKAQHMKTFLYIEQLLLKNNVHDKVLKVAQSEQGLDFFFKSKQHAQRLVDFVTAVVPTRVKPSKQLVSQDERNNVANYKYSWSIEIPRICKDDLIVIPQKLQRELGGCVQLLLCYKVSTGIHCLDPVSLRRIDISPAQYFTYEPDFHLLSLRHHTTEFLVMDAEKSSKSAGAQHPELLNESFLSSISNVFLDRITEVQVSRTSDWASFNVKTHLGNMMKVGATVIGFDLTKMNSGELEGISKNRPDVILVRRVYPQQKNKKRIWKLRRLEKDGVMVDEEGGAPKKKGKGGSKKDKLNEERDLEEFMDDIERDKEMRAKIALYRDEEAIKKLTPEELAKKLQRQQRGTHKKGVQWKDRKVVRVEVGKKAQIQQKQEGVEVTGAEGEEESKKDEKTFTKIPVANKNTSKGQKAGDNDNDGDEGEWVDAIDDDADDDEDDEEDRNEVKLSELMNDLRIEDSDEEGDQSAQQDLLDEKLVEEFVKAIDKVKIEK